jgi:hypothetical protein
MIRTFILAGTAAVMLAAPIGGLAQAQQLDGGPYYGAQRGHDYDRGWNNDRNNGWNWGGRDSAYDARPGVVYEGRSAASGGGRYCIKLCEQDTNPCDPIQYKRADRRCSENGDF